MLKKFKYDGNYGGDKMCWVIDGINDSQQTADTKIKLFKRVWNF